MRVLLGVVVLLIMSPELGWSQEYLTPLKTNPDLQYHKESTNRPEHRRAAQMAVALPFIDDFSNRSIYPNPVYWIDSQVYVNSTLPVAPPSIGVATFEGLKANGEPYSYKAGTSGPADTLTSRKIDLGALTPADSVILSFFLEPKGLGNAPGPRDTFLLDVKLNDSTWTTMWRQTSTNLSPDSFIQVFVTLKNPNFFKADFQFRFRNYASLTGNVDHWHLDYVILDRDRSVSNKFLNDVAFNEPPRSLLKNYEAMPLAQFVGHEDDELKDSIYASANNHFNVIKNTTFRYRALENCTQTVLKSDFFQTINFPRLSDTVLQESLFGDEIKSYVGSIGCDSLVINTRYVLFNSPPDPATGFNDTVYHEQRFHNYFAYDDGTVERGYNVIGNSPKFALKFNLNEPDSLQAVRLHWPHIDKNLSNELVNLIVWQSIDKGSGEDDSVRYRKDLIQPEYVDSLNGFTTYLLDSAIYMSDSFYIGFQRANADTVQVGYDMNSVAPGRLYYYTSGSWRPSLFPGTVMVRAVMGDPLPRPSAIAKSKITPEPVAFYPNPVRERLVLGNWEKVQGLPFELMGINGQVFHNGLIDQRSVNVSMLPKGIHLIRIFDNENGRAFYGKFVKVE